MKRYLLAISAFALSLLVFDAAAQAWPTKPLRAIVPVGAGSSTDIVHRLVLEQLSAQLGQPIVVENRVGAGGTIGSAVVAKSEPDGYTILAHGSALTIAPALYKGLPYHPARDFIAVVPVGISASVLVVSPAKGVSSAAELVAVAKARPGALNFSSVGVGSATHLSAERFVSSAGIQAVHVPFKGGAEAMLEVIAGRVDFFFGPVALVLPQIREGKLRALGGQRIEPFHAAARCPDASRSRHQGGGISDLVRAICAGQDAFGHREQTQSRNAERAASAQGARETRSARRRSYGHVAGRVCSAYRSGDRS